MKRKLYKLRRDSYKLRALTNHQIHRELKQANSKYGEEILKAKRQHWSDFLEEATASSIWTMNRYIKEPSGDGETPECLLSES
jgi:hypothetical protein